MGFIAGIGLAAAEGAIAGASTAAILESIAATAVVGLLQYELNKPTSVAGAPVTLPAEGNPLPITFGHCLVGGTIVAASPIVVTSGQGGK